MRKLLAVIALLGASVCGAQSPVLDETALVRRHCPLGLPSSGDLRFRKGYVLSHNNWLKIPNWVAYSLTRDKLSGRERRGSRFQADPSLKPHQRAEPEDYRGSGLDRGHLAPAGDMKSDKEEMSESFLLSNIAPQVGSGFNRGIWKDLEALVRRWAEESGEVWVATGPLIMPDDAGDAITFKLIGKRRVAVPTHFFKIVHARPAAGDTAPRVIAFILPNQEIRDEEIPGFIATVDQIEEYTGLDFFPDLDDGVEEHVEGSKAFSLESW